MTLLVGMTTADRTPRRNYVGETLKDLYRSSPELDPKRVHVFATAPDVGWLEKEVRKVGFAEVRDACVLHVPRKKLTRNENGLALFTGMPRCGWVLHLEDDLLFCKDFMGSVGRWLGLVSKKRVWKVHTFCVFKGAPKNKLPYWNQPSNSFGLLAVALRYQHVQEFADWARRKLPVWRSNMRVPWRVSGFDMLVRIWAKEPFLASNPSFVQHAGDESLTHAFRKRPIMRSPHFAGEDWRFEWPRQQQ